MTKPEPNPPFLLRSPEATQYLADLEVAVERECAVAGHTLKLIAVTVLTNRTSTTFISGICVCPGCAMIATATMASAMRDAMTLAMAKGDSAPAAVH